MCVRDVDAFLAFYRDHLGATVRQSAPGKHEVCFGAAKISVQTPDTLPAIAANTAPGTANICLISDEPVAELFARLREAGIETVSDIARRDGATGALLSAHIRDPEGNLVEIANRL